MTIVPFNRPYITGRESGLMVDAMTRGHLSGDGYYTKRASSLLAQVTGVEDVLLTTSCTHALEMAAILADLQPGDEVIMPSFTFVSCANAFLLRGARPVFVDIRADTYNIDETLIEAAITSRTKAIIVVHYAGVACEMTAILGIAERHGLIVIEDAAHALGATYKGHALGSLGQLATLSFHETKNIHCGEGGALLISDPKLIERSEIIREKGTNRSRFFRGQVDKYTWVDIGSSYLPSDLLAAFLTAQLESFDDIQTQRLAVWSSYASELASWAEHQSFTLPTIPHEVTHSAHLFGLLAPDLRSRQALISHMASVQVSAVFHYVPLHSSPMGRRYSAGLVLPVTDAVSERLVRMPLFAGLGPSELDRVLSAVTSFVS
jgi:dTDP-4-amino-4,6-dideoxygalactose transaminase